MRIGRVREFLASVGNALARNDGVVAIDGLEDEVALDAGFDAARSDCTELALMMLRPDGLPMVGERYGKLAGEQVVRSFAGCAELCLDDPFLLFQLGDGEFCCIFPGTSAEVATSIGETIRARFAATLTLTRAGPVFATASVGVVSSRQLGFNVDTLRAAAHQMLEEASRQGGNRVTCFAGEPSDQGQSAKLDAGAFRPSSRERAAALR